MRVSDILAAPPSHAARFQTDDLDEIGGFLRRYDGNHKRVALERGPVGYSTQAVRCGQVGVSWVRSRTRQKIAGALQGVVLHLQLSVRQTYVAGRRSFEASPDQAVLIPAGREYTLYSEPGNAVSVLHLPANALEGELRGRDRESAVPGRGLIEIALDGGRLTAIAAIHRALVDATNPESGDTAHAAQLQAWLCSWMADQITGTRAAATASALGAQRVRAVEEWIDANLGEPITLGRLCAVAGIGDRYLESSFRAHRGRTPMQFVLARRLAWVRRRLLEAQPGDSVTQIAHDAGLVHLGRFAARYRSSYCESPSATLRRSLDRS